MFFIPFKNLTLSLLIFLILSSILGHAKEKESVRYLYQEKKEHHSSFKDEIEEQIGLMLSWMTTSGVQISSELAIASIIEDNHTKNRLEFISFNYFQIQKEIAQGGGEKLDTLARLYHVKNIEHWEYILHELYPVLYKQKHSVELFDKKMIKLTQYLNEKW